MSETNGSPTLGEVFRNMEALSRRFDQLDVKVDRISSIAFEAKFDEVNRRLGNLERTGREGAATRSNATWQVLFLVLGAVVALAIGAIAGSMR